MARKPPLRTDKFAALWRIAAPVHPIRRSNYAESGYCELIRPRKGHTSNTEGGQRAETAWSKSKGNCTMTVVLAYQRRVRVLTEHLRKIERDLEREP